MILMYDCLLWGIGLIFSIEGRDVVLRSWEGGDMFCYFRKVIAVAILYSRNLACSVRGNSLIGRLKVWALLSSYFNDKFAFR